VEQLERKAEPGSEGTGHRDIFEWSGAEMVGWNGGKEGVFDCEGGGRYDPTFWTLMGGLGRERIAVEGDE